jgi:hypothetical protein
MPPIHLKDSHRRMPKWRFRLSADAVMQVQLEPTDRLSIVMRRHHLTQRPPDRRDSRRKPRLAKCRERACPLTSAEPSAIACELMACSGSRSRWHERRK